MYCLPERLKRLRQSMHLSQEQLARLLGVDRSTISSYESDVRQPPLDTLSRIADVFGVSTDYLLGRTNELSFDVFDLTREDTALLYKLASELTEKNRKIRQLQER
ncbi:MAG: helix-turn-helix domain-containing protein [Oscillospiraceae bacterium]|nr:helix-turn-helix domain-containing protein [Oscillospiraceae bacterium]